MKVKIIMMYISSIISIIIAYKTGNIWSYLVGIMFLIVIVDIYESESDKKTIYEYEELLDKYYEIVGKQNREIWRLRKEKDNDK